MRYISMLLAVALLFTACGAGRSARSTKNDKILVAAGTSLPEMGLAFDADYDPSTDSLVPGYKIVTVAIVNQSMNLISLDPLADKWIVEDADNSNHTAILSLRQQDAATWRELPSRLRKSIEYPFAVAIGATQPIDILVPARAKLDGFKSVTFKSSGLQKTIKIVQTR